MAYRLEQNTSKKVYEIMAVYFELHSNGESVKFSVIDREMCDTLEVFCDPIDYYKNWYDTIGFGIACGQTWSQLRETWTEKLDVIDYLEANYTPICYGGR